MRRQRKNSINGSSREAEDFTLRLHAHPTQRGMRMADVVNTSVAPFCHSQDHPGSVPVSVVGKAALPAQEGSFCEPESLLGSRETTRTRHRRVCGRDQHHLSTGPHGTLDQLPFQRPDRCIGGLPGHRRLGEELRREVLDRDQVVIVDDALHPGPPIMPGLASSLLLQGRRLLAGPLVSLGLRATPAAVSSGHLPLCFAEFGGAALTMPQIWQVELRMRGRGRDGYTPIDADRTALIDRGGSDDFASHHEGCVPVPERIPVYSHTGRLARQLPRPHHWDHDALRKAQPTVAAGEPSGAVLERRKRLPARLELRAPAAFLRERVLQRLRIRAQNLLLRNLRTLAQPGVVAAGIGQELSKPGERRLETALLLSHSLVPQIAAAMPLRFERTFSHHARPEPIAVTHDFLHSMTIVRSTDMKRRQPHTIWLKVFIHILEGGALTRESR